MVPWLCAILLLGCGWSPLLTSLTRHTDFFSAQQVAKHKPVVLKNGSVITFAQSESKFVMRDVESAGG